MLGMFKKKPVMIHAPCSGVLIPIEEVADEVFAGKMAGEGVAIIPSVGLFVAPIDGRITQIFETLHAYTIKNFEGLEVMVHIGLDTVTLQGKGFTPLASEGDIVKVGDGIIKADLAFLKANEKDIVTPVIITNAASRKTIIKKTGEIKTRDIIMEVK